MTDSQADPRLLASVKARTAQLVIAIRPSIVRSLGYDYPPLDLLDDNGLALWGLAIDGVVQDLTSPEYAHLAQDSATAAVTDWLVQDLQAEQTRWRSPSTLLWQLDYVTDAWPSMATRDPAVGQNWQRNVRAAEARAVHGNSGLTSSDLARLEQVSDRLEGSPAADTLGAALGSLATSLPLIDPGEDALGGEGTHGAHPTAGDRYCSMTGVQREALAAFLDHEHVGRTAH